MKVAIVGAGIGGLSCAIACRKHGLDVVLIEKAAEMLPVSGKSKCCPQFN